MLTRLFPLIFLTLLLAACAGQAQGPQPPEIKYGQDLCDQCGMAIDEARFAAGTLLTTGEYRKFDDIGEMLVYHMEHLQDQVSIWYVHDYNTEKWLLGEDAVFVRSAEMKTPMGFGIVAFADGAQAEKFAAEHGGEIFTLDQMRVKLHEEVHG